ncbi:baseplate assembly protein [Rhizobium laguerreae]|uniref:baseplate assembly protein n=1 Tax=Rhizobium laguerreae TaxID=1076926 RepID=UPI001C903F1B|nr:baseplate J/gp47 family protein [Rhizobium laguerreae]MBY3434821.1 baseplate J protein [Rhizobium laguerreae]MBY3448964.1 baseplate J protein [Rhizobium laguerreae]MBY3456738.1 baseplate J protein [Rhizobium laguerreae]
MVDLSTLPTPQVIEEIDYEALVARQKETFQTLWEAVRIANPDMDLPQYDVALLRTDPVMIIIEANAYREMLERVRINNAARANLLGKATGADLDNIAADHGVTRLTGESDDALRERVVLADQGRSTAGPEEWYEFHARSVDVDIRDAKVYRPGSGPEIEIAILTTSGGGTPGAPLLAAITAAVTDPAVRSINDVLTVVAAVKTTVNVAAQVWLLPDTPMSVFDGLSAGLTAALASEGGIGFDVNRAWITARLMPAGVSKVVLTTPSTDVVMDEFSAAAFGTISLTFMGRSR